MKAVTAVHFGVTEVTIAVEIEMEGCARERAVERHARRFMCVEPGRLLALNVALSFSEATWHRPTHILMQKIAECVLRALESLAIPTFYPSWFNSPPANPKPTRVAATKSGQGRLRA